MLHKRSPWTCRNLSPLNGSREIWLETRFKQVFWTEYWRLLVWLSSAGIIHTGFSKDLKVRLKIKLLAILQDKQNVSIGLRIRCVVRNLQLAIPIRSIWKSYSLPPIPLPNGHSLLSLFDICKSSTFHLTNLSLCCEIVLSVQFSSQETYFFHSWSYRYWIGAS